MKTTAKFLEISDAQLFLWFVTRILINNNSDRELVFLKNRSAIVKCNNILEAVQSKAIIDSNIVKILNIISDKKLISLLDFTNHFVINNIGTSIESHCFSSKNGLHIAKINSLGTYDQMNYDCFVHVPITKLKVILKGEQIDCDLQTELHIGQIIGLFLCEISRNPSAIVTLPICIELANNINVKKFFEKKLSSLQDGDSEMYDEDSEMSYTPEEALHEELRDQLNKLNIYDAFLNVQEDLTLQKIVKFFIVEMSPLSMKEAVSACRHVNKKINEKLEPLEISHHYDMKNTVGNILKAQEFLKKELHLLDFWALVKSFENEKKDYKEFHKNIISDILIDWYNYNSPDIQEEYIAVLGEIDWLGA